MNPDPALLFTAEHFFFLETLKKNPDQNNIFSYRFFFSKKYFSIFFRTFWDFQNFKTSIFKIWLIFPKISQNFEKIFFRILFFDKKIWFLSRGTGVKHPLNMFLAPSIISDAPWTPKQIDIGFVKRRFGLQIPPAGPDSMKPSANKCRYLAKYMFFTMRRAVRC